VLLLGAPGVAGAAVTPGDYGGGALKPDKAGRLKSGEGWTWARVAADGRARIGGGFTAPCGPARFDAEVTLAPDGSFRFSRSRKMRVPGGQVRVVVTVAGRFDGTGATGTIGARLRRRGGGGVRRCSTRGAWQMRMPTVSPTPGAAQPSGVYLGPPSQQGNVPVEVIEVARPNRQVRRRHGKTDVVDAIAAARAVQSGEATGTPKSHDGPVEALRTLTAVQRSGNKARTQALNQIHQLLVTAPEQLRARLRLLPRKDLLATCAAFRIAADDDSLQAMTRLALRELAQRVLHLDEQLAAVTKRLHRITADIAPKLVATTGVGPAVASALLITAGDNPHRMASEAAFAALCGSNPIPASSGKTNRHRLNRGGDRNANAALWRIVIVRLACDERTRQYLARRQAEGKTKTEAIRCLKRYVAREIFNAMPSTVAI
jgi:transposase